MLAVWLAASYEGGNGTGAGRIALVAVALLAVGAFTVLQVKARSRRRQAPSERGPRRYDPSDWRTWPPPSWPGGRDDEAPSGNEESYRPDWRYGYPPGYEPYPRYDPARSPWAVRDDAARDRSSLSWRPGWLGLARPGHDMRASRPPGPGASRPAPTRPAPIRQKPQIGRTGFHGCYNVMTLLTTLPHPWNRGPPDPGGEPGCLPKLDAAYLGYLYQ